MYKKKLCIFLNSEIRNNLSCITIFINMLLILSTCTLIFSSLNRKRTQVLWPYTPPANPNKFRNPIVILLVQESRSFAFVTQRQLNFRDCSVRGISKNLIRECLRYLSYILSTGRCELDASSQDLN